jgi:hypothetical protein
MRVAQRRRPSRLLRDQGKRERSRPVNPAAHFRRMAVWLANASEMGPYPFTRPYILAPVRRSHTNIQRESGPYAGREEHL